MFETLSRMGTLGAIWIALAIVLAVLWRRPWLLVLVIGADAVADLAATALKAATGRTRPAFVYDRPRPLVHVPHDHAFPSGHAATSFACATVLGAAFPRFAPGFFVLALAIGFSRIYVGAHWPLDVVGGAVLGIAVGLAVTLLLPRAAGRWRSARAR